MPDALRASAQSKAAKLLRHHRRIVRIRIDFEQRHENDCDQPAAAFGRVEVKGPDLVATVASPHFSKSLDLLVDKLDRMVRERTKGRVNRRNDRPAGAEFRDFIAPAT